MQSDHSKIRGNCLAKHAILVILIVVGSVQAERYHSYNQYDRLQFYYDQPQYQQPQKTATQQFFATVPPPPVRAPANLNARQNQDVSTQIVQGSERFTFDMIYVSKIFNLN